MAQTTASLPLQVSHHKMCHIITIEPAPDLELQQTANPSVPSPPTRHVSGYLQARMPALCISGLECCSILDSQNLPSFQENPTPLGPPQCCAVMSAGQESFSHLTAALLTPPFELKTEGPCTFTPNQHCSPERCFGRCSLFARLLN